MERYAAYIRTSRGEQSIFSLDAQKRIIQNWIKAQGGELYKVYADSGISGRTTERPSFKQMCQDAATGKFDAVVVHRFDRFARNSIDALTVKSLLRREYKVKVFSVSEPSEETHGEMGRLIEAILDTVAEWYSRNASKEVAKGKRERAMNGYHNNLAPYGMKKDKEGILRPDYDELAGLRLAFELYKTGKYNDYQIAHALNERGYRNKKGELFPTSAIEVLLTNRIYLGYVRYRQTRYHADGTLDTSAPIEWFKGKHNAVIDEALFEKCQEIRASRASHHTYTQPYRSYLLRDIVFCAECEENKPHNVSSDTYGKMWTVTGSGGRIAYYRCHARDYGRDCSQKQVNILKVESNVVRVLMNPQFPGEWRHNFIHAVAEELQHRLREERFSKVKAIVERMDFEQEFGFILNPYVYLRQNALLERRIAALPALPMNLLEKAADMVENFSKYWWATGGDRQAQEELLQLLVVRVWTKDQHVTEILLRGNLHLMLK